MTGEEKKKQEEGELGENLEEELKEEELEKSEDEKKEEEEQIEEEEEPEEELSTSDVDAVPLIICSEDQELMDIQGTVSREVEERTFFFKTSTENRLHLKYTCPKCGRSYFHDMESKRQGCFIATAAFGTSLAEEINVLRKVRDSYLVHRDWGEKLVNAYYTLSPPVANLIEKSDSLKKLVRVCLVPLINCFKEENEQE